jgi:hypothetical protein
MSKTTIKLEGSTAKKIYKTADKELKSILEESFPAGFFSEKITDRIQDFDDVLEELGKTYEEVIPWKKPVTKAQKSQNAFAKLQCIAEVYNEGTVSDWTNTSVYKYLPYKYFSGGSWSVHASHFWFSSLHCSGSIFYKSAELSSYSYDKFKDIWEDFWAV